MDLVTTTQMTSDQKFLFLWLYIIFLINIKVVFTPISCISAGHGRTYTALGTLQVYYKSHNNRHDDRAPSSAELLKDTISFAVSQFFFKATDRLGAYLSDKLSDLSDNCQIRLDRDHHGSMGAAANAKSKIYYQCSVL